MISKNRAKKLNGDFQTSMPILGVTKQQGHLVIALAHIDSAALELASAADHLGQAKYPADEKAIRELAASVKQAIPGWYKDLILDVYGETK